MIDIKKLLDEAFAFDKYEPRTFFNLCYGPRTAYITREHAVECMNQAAKDQHDLIAPLAKEIIEELVEALERIENLRFEKPPKVEEWVIAHDAIATLAARLRGSDEK